MSTYLHVLSCSLQYVYVLCRYSGFDSRFPPVSSLSFGYHVDHHQRMSNSRASRKTKVQNALECVIHHIAHTHARFNFLTSQFSSSLAGRHPPAIACCCVSSPCAIDLRPRDISEEVISDTGGYLYLSN